jgi:hypothetical protein
MRETIICVLPSKDSDEKVEDFEYCCRNCMQYIGPHRMIKSDYIDGKGNIFCSKFCITKWADSEI